VNTTIKLQNYFHLPTFISKILRLFFARFPNLCYNFIDILIWECIGVFNIPSTRLTVPRAATGEIVRKNLIDTVLNSTAKLVYIHAGAGHGKTTLLSQVADSIKNAVWLSLDGESDIFTFINSLCAAIKQTFPEFGFSVSEYLPFSGKDNFISMLAGTLICSIEHISDYFIAPALMNWTCKCWMLS
jgi:hypothetical protein